MMNGFFAPLTANGLTLKVYLLCMAAALLCGILAALAASFRSRLTKSFLLSLLFLPAIVHTVIAMVNGNLGTGVAVMGAFSLVRFRSVPGKAKEIVCLFLSMTAGLACAAGYAVLAILFTALVGAGMVLVGLIPLSVEREMELRITVPESLSYTDAFDEVFVRYLKKSALLSVKTTNMGSLYKLLYRVEMKDRGEIRAFLDDLRCRNGNLEISLSEAPERGEDL
ncbi:MAG: DUF4956 domain-containing protein [Clostridia bacterium]|nr:DUF4956 domain-containing protein [Clostridia bacterium]